MNSSMKSKVSIYISTCNRLEKLKRAIDSVFQQSYKNIEILICDDASSDGTKEFATELCNKDHRVIYLRNETNKGACATRNLGINNATGHFITGLDDDDVFYEDRVSFFIENWNDKYSFICCNFENKYSDELVMNYRRNSIKILSYKDMLFSNEASNQVFTLTERLKSIGGFDPQVRRLQDWDTWLRLSFKFGEFIRYPESKYIMYHDHSANELRVSKSYSFQDALSDMCERNTVIYSPRSKKIVSYIIKLDRGSLKFSELINWVLISKEPVKVAKFIYHHMKNK